MLIKLRRKKKNASKKRARENALKSAQTKETTKTETINISELYVILIKTKMQNARAAKSKGGGEHRSTHTQTHARALMREIER